MPNLVIYVPAAVWRRFEKLEGAAAKDVARTIARDAIVKYVSQDSTPDGLAPSRPFGTSGVAVVTADRDSGVEVLPVESDS